MCTYAHTQSFIPAGTYLVLYYYITEDNNIAAAVSIIKNMFVNMNMKGNKFVYTYKNKS